MKNIVLIAFFCLFLVKYTFALEKIEDTSIFEYYQNKELKIIASKIKKVILIHTTGHHLFSWVSSN